MSSAPFLGPEEESVSGVEGHQTERSGFFEWLHTVGGGFHRYALFGYFSPYMRLAKEEGSSAVRPDVLPNLWPSDDLVKWSNRFTASQNRQKSRASSKWALLYTLYSAFWFQFIGILFIKIVGTVVTLSSILLMGRFLRWQEQSPEGVTIAERNMGRSNLLASRYIVLSGLLAGAGILALELLNILGGAQCNFWIQRVGLRVQGVLAAGLFKRVIRAPDWGESQESGPKASAYNLLMVI